MPILVWVRNYFPKILPSSISCLMGEKIFQRTRRIHSSILSLWTSCNTFNEKLYIWMNMERIEPWSCCCVTDSEPTVSIFFH